MNTAILPASETFNGYNYGPEKPLVDSYLVCGIRDNDIHEIAVLRIYDSKSRNALSVYASIWVHGRAAGHGSTRGYGYHKASAAADEAIRSAGIRLEQDINGRGERAIEDALHAIGVACGYDTVRVFRA